MDHLNVDSVVWASAKRDIFWPGQVVERNMADETASPKAILTVRFLIEDSYEDIKNQNKIFPWNCENQEKFIGKGRGLKNQTRKLQFNMAVAEGDNLSMQQEERLKGNNVGMKRRSAGGETGAFLPRKSPRRHMSSGCSSEHPGTFAKSITESLISDIKDDNSSLKNGESHKTVRSNIAGKGKDFEITKGSCTVGTRRLRNKNRIADSSLDHESEALSASEKRGSRRKSFQGESVMSAEKLAGVRNSPRCKLKQGSPEKACQNKLGLTLSGEQTDQKQLSDARSRSRRKTSQLDELKTVTAERNLGRKRGSSQDESQISTLRKNEDERLNSLSTRNGHVTTPQRKRKLSVETEPKQRRTLTKKEKSCDQNGLKQETVKSNNLPRTSNYKETILPNGHKNSMESNKEQEMHISIETAGEGNMTSVGENCNVSSDSASSDDELMTEAFSPSQESSQFSVNDIVWAKYFTEPYWPAVIRRLVTGKRKRDNKTLVQFLAWNNILFKIQPMKLVHFACDQSQRDEFLRAKEKLNHELQERFQQALGEAEALLNLKGLGKSLNEMDEDNEVFLEEEDDGKEVSEITKESKDDVPEKKSLFQCRKSSRAKKQVSQYGNILSYIRQAKTFLRQILNGSKSSERHMIYTSGRVSERDNLKRRAGFGPIADDNLRDEIMGLLLQFYEEFKGSPDITYVSEVWLPEALIWSIQQIQHVDRQKAEEMYLEGSKLAVTDEEVNQLTAKLKQKNLSQTEAMERLQKAERVIARVSQ